MKANRLDFLRNNFLVHAAASLFVLAFFVSVIGCGSAQMDDLQAGDQALLGMAVVEVPEMGTPVVDPASYLIVPDEVRATLLADDKVATEYEELCATGEGEIYLYTLYTLDRCPDQSEEIIQELESGVEISLSWMFPTIMECSAIPVVEKRAISAMVYPQGDDQPLRKGAKKWLEAAFVCYATYCAIAGEDLFM